MSIQTSSIHSPSSQAVRRLEWGIWLLLVLLALAAGGGLLWFFGQSFAAARAVADTLSRDGSFERLTPDLFDLLRLPALAVGALLLLGGIASLAWRRQTQFGLARWLRWLADRVRILPADAAHLVRDIAPARSLWPEIGLLMLFAVLARLLFLTRTMAHDEAYTVVAFAMRPWLAVISDYHLPNNHIFHTILVKLSVELFGLWPWTVRLPALLAGLLTIPATYLLAKRLYDRQTALLSAALIAYLPIMVLYSSNARGYSLYTLLSVVIFGLAVYLKNHNNRAGWLLLVIGATIGFYTVPMMLYPFGATMLWLFITALVEAPAPDYGSRRRLIVRIVAAGALVGLFAALLYLPVVVLGTGLQSLMTNPFVASKAAATYSETLRARVVDAYTEWLYALPDWSGLLLAVGVGLSLLLYRWISRIKVHLLLVTVPWLYVVLNIQRADPMGRVWNYLVPFLVIWMVAGFIELLNLFLRRARSLPPQAISTTVVIVLSLLLIGAAYVRTKENFPALQPFPEKIEQIVQYLQPRLQEGDIVITSSVDDPVVWYYFRQYRIPDSIVHNLEDHAFPFERAFVLVHRGEDQTMLSAIEQRGLDPAEFRLEEARLVNEVNGMEVYECPMR